MTHRSLQNRRKAYHQAGRLREEQQQGNEQFDLSREALKKEGVNSPSQDKSEDSGEESQSLERAQFKRGRNDV